MTRPLLPIGITGWSWVGALGSEYWLSTGQQEDQGQTGARLRELLQLGGLKSHKGELGIPGASGKCPIELPALIKSLAQYDSRCARLLAFALDPLVEAVHSACRKYGADRVGIVLASSTGGIDATETFLAERKRGTTSPDYQFQKTHPHHALLNIVRGLTRARGPAVIVSTACSSAAKALGSAQRLI